MKQMKKAEPQIVTQNICQLFGIPLASYYYKPVQQPDKDNILEIMKQIHADNLESYGKRRMSQSLKKQGKNIGVFKAASLMKEAFIVAKVPKKPHYYPSGTQMPNIPNLLKRQFDQDHLNTHWVGDITYIRNHHGWSYLATVLDLGTREIVGYHLSQTPDAELAKQALLHAIQMQQPDTKQLLFHSDQGVQYNAHLFKDTLKLHKITQRMSRRGNCWDNSVQERFFRNLKSEYLNSLSFINHQSVITAVEHYIRYYNHKRLNSAVDYLTPVQKRLELLKVA
jgi:transposase InsO family protein